ncbi:MAG: SufS family cysteine desulfurase [bacterium]|nr:SufS family cysteine desulfurase [bacterium]
MSKISEKIKDQFPILKQKMHGKILVYLDSAATTQKPNSVIAAELAFYTTSNANVHRGVYALAERATADYLAAHQRVAQFIGAENLEEIIFTKNTTEAINLVAQSLPKELFKKKKILVSIMEHHSNLLPWQRLAEESDGSLEFVEFTKDGKLDLADLHRKLTKDVALVAVTHISNVLGVVNPVSKIAHLAHKQDALVLVDAAQSVARLPLDVKKMGVDFLVFSGHKMYGPMGIGVLYGRKVFLEKMEPFLLGGDMVTTVTRKTATWNDLPWKFEAGTPNVAGAMGLVAAIDFIDRIGIKNIWKHEQELVEYLLPRLTEIKELKIIGPSARAGVVSFTVAGLHSHDLASLLDLEGVAVRAGQHCAQPLLETLGIKECTRVSFSVTTTTEELDIFITALKKSIKILQRNG